MVNTLTASDQAAFTDVASILDKHGLLDKFGLVLRHQHFPINPTEVVHEINDGAGRISLRRILSEEALPDEAYPTEWVLNADGAPHATAWCCD